MLIVIPMAGESSRFLKEGYTLPKYMLYAADKSLFNISISSFRGYFKAASFLFICRSSFGSEQFIQQECKLLGIERYEIVSLKQISSGQGETVKMGLEKSSFSLEEEIVIFNIDTLRKNFKLANYPDNVAGYLEVFSTPGDNWSFVEVEPGTDEVIRTAEKVRISDFCSNGLYYFKSGILFITALNSYYKDVTGKETYIAPIYNYLSMHYSVKMIKVSNEDIVTFGTPNEYIQFLKLTLID